MMPVHCCRGLFAVCCAPSCSLTRAPMRQFQAAATHAENLAANLEAKAAENEEKRKESQLAGYKPNDVWGEVSGIPMGV